MSLHKITSNTCANRATDVANSSEKLALNISQSNFYKLMITTQNTFNFFSEAHPIASDQSDTELLNLNNKLELGDKIPSDTIEFNYSNEFKFDLSCMHLELSTQENSMLNIEILHSLFMKLYSRGLSAVYCTGTTSAISLYWLSYLLVHTQYIKHLNLSGYFKNFQSNLMQDLKINNNIKENGTISDMLFNTSDVNNIQSEIKKNVNLVSNSFQTLVSAYVHQLFSSYPVNLLNKMFSSHITELKTSAKANLKYSTVIYHICQKYLSNFYIIIQSIALNSSLEILDISHNNLGLLSNIKLEDNSKNANYMWLKFICSAINKNNSIKAVDFSYNPGIGSIGCGIIAKFLSLNNTLQSINLSHCNIIDTNDLDNNVEEPYKDEDDIIEDVESTMDAKTTQILSNLQFMQLVENYPENKINTLKEELNITDDEANTNTTDNFIENDNFIEKYLFQNKDLSEQYLLTVTQKCNEKMHAPYYSGMEAIAELMTKNAHLKELNLSNNNLGILKKEMNMDEIKKKFNTIFFDILKIISGKRNDKYVIPVENIIRYYEHISNNAFKELNPGLTKDNEMQNENFLVPYSLIADIIRPIAHYNRIVKLDLSSNNFDDGDILQLSLLLSTSKSIQYLNIANNNFTMDGVFSLVLFLKVNTSLKTLTMDHIKKFNLTEYKINPNQTSITYKPNLYKFYFIINLFGYALGRHPQIQYIDISHNFLGPYLSYNFFNGFRHGLLDMAKRSESNGNSAVHNLEYINFSHNDLCGARNRNELFRSKQEKEQCWCGIAINELNRILFLAYKYLPKLSNLLLGYNNITDKGITQLLTCNSISPENIPNVAYSTITHLGLTDNYLTELSLHKIILFNRQSSTLRLNNLEYLDFSRNNIDNTETICKHLSQVNRESNDKPMLSYINLNHIPLGLIKVSNFYAFMEQLLKVFPLRTIELSNAWLTDYHLIAMHPFLLGNRSISTNLHTFSKLKHIICNENFITSNTIHYIFNKSLLQSTNVAHFECVPMAKLKETSKIFKCIETIIQSKSNSVRYIKVTPDSPKSDVYYKLFEKNI